MMAGFSSLIFADSATNAEADTEAEQHFEKAYELRKAADYDAAIVEYNKVLNLSPDGKIARNAQYWIGQSHFEARQFDAALSAFEKLIDEYPASAIIPSTKEMIERVQQAKKNRSLFEAVKKGNIEQVRLLIAEGADVDAKWGDINTKEEEKKAKAWNANDTPLCCAVDANNMDLVKLLVEAGADINAAGSWPPLCRAVDKNNTAIAEYLIDHGANVNAYPIDEGWGPIQETAHVSNSIEMAKLLLARGADINSEIYPALHISINQKRIDLCELLIERGADVNGKDNWGYTPLCYAAQTGITELVQLLLEAGADVNGGLYEPTIHVGIRSGHRNIVELLIQHGADVNAKDNKSRREYTPLQHAAITGRTEAVKLLLEAGADISAKDDRGQTALHVPLDNRNSDYPEITRTGYRLSKDTIEMLLTKGADVNLKDKDGRTPLHLASDWADGDIVILLLDKGARVNEKDGESGFTALHHAARFGNKNAAEVLIARGADINAKDKQGHTPLYFAVNHDYKVAELLINKGADSDIQTESGQTLLELAQERKEIESTVPDMVFDGDPNSSLGDKIACGDVDGDGYDDILISALRYNNFRGRVSLFYGGPDMDTTADLILEGQNAGDKFGHGISFGDIDNDGYEDIIIGACRYGERQGRAYLYWGRDRNSMDANPDKIFDGENEKGSVFGVSSAVYDIDNDGYDDIILGAAGRAYLYFGNTKESMDTSYDLIFKQENPKYSFGYRISCGDIDNDGYGDIVIGPWWSSHGQAYLYYGGSRSNMDAKADVIFKAQTEGNDFFGTGIVCVDQNKDGYDDIVMGAPGYNDEQSRSYLFYGNSKKSMDANPDIIFDGEVEQSNYGTHEVCGDIDGDKVNDIVIGAYLYRRGVGRVYVYWGKDLSAPNPKAGRILTGENPKDKFGLGLACGDVNNDGFDDLVVGAYGYKPGAKQGRAYLYYGGPKNK
jgi:ankyrin repeat protein